MKKGSLVAFVALFMALCLLPVGAMLLGYEGENRENRPLAREAELFGRNGLNLSFPEDFDDWFSDHFGLREEMVTAFNYSTMATLCDTLNENVVVGRNGFLFYSETLDDYLGLDLMTEDEIEKAAACLRLESEYCESLGISFTFAAAPDKSTIYPEYMPARLSPTGESSNRERLYAALGREGVAAVDLASLLISHKDDGQLYYSLDTHWNDRGALIAYRALMDNAGLEHEGYEGLAETETLSGDGDLNNFVLPKLSGRLVSVSYGITFDYSLDEGANVERDSTFATSSASSGSVLMFRDSFGDALVKYISSNVGRAVYSKEFPHNYTFLPEGASAVIAEIVERNIPNILESAPLMPAVETGTPEGFGGALEATLDCGESGGYMRIYGCYGGGFDGGIFVTLTSSSGDAHTYEAFPILDRNADTLDGALGEGYTATLPKGLSGSYSVTVSAAGGTSEPFSLTIE